MLKKINNLKILIMFLVVFTLSACTSTKTMTNGEYKGELSFPFIGAPEGEGTFKSNSGEEYEGIFEENKFDGILKNRDGTIFDGTITGDIFNDEGKKLVSYTYEGFYTDGKSNYKIEKMKIDVENKTLVNNFYFEGYLVEDGIKFTGIYDYNKENKILSLSGKYEENENEYFDGNLEISNYEIDITYNEKFGFIEFIEFEDIIESYDLTFDGIIDYSDIYLDGVYSLEIENDIIWKLDFNGIKKDDKFTFEGKMNFDREKSEYIVDGIEKEDEVVLYSGKITMENIEDDRMDKLTLKRDSDGFFSDDLEDSDFDYYFDGKLYDEGNLVIDGKYTYKADSETLTIDGKKYEKNTNNKYVLFLDGKFTLTSNSLKGKGKVYSIYDGSLIESGDVDFNY